MKAIDFKDFGDADVLQLTDMPAPQLRPADLLVRVHAAGLNRADINQRRGAYGRADFGDSTVMGLEMTGEVIALGQDVHGFAIGERVMGIVGGGAYAEIARIDHRMAIRVPGNLSDVEAAAVPEAFVTAHEALVHLGRLEAGEKVLVHAAASGVGSAAIQLAHAIGATVFGTAGGSKLEQVCGFGADHAIDYRTEDFESVIASRTDGCGVDVVIDFIGAPYLERNIRSLAEGGRLVQVGLMGGAKDAVFPMDRLLFRHLQIMGTVMKSRPAGVKQAMVRRFSERWLPCFESGQLRPVVDSVFPLERAGEAHRRMESNESVGKIVLTMTGAGAAG